MLEGLLLQALFRTLDLTIVLRKGILVFGVKRRIYGTVSLCLI